MSLQPNIIAQCLLHLEQTTERNETTNRVQRDSTFSHANLSSQLSVTPNGVVVVHV